MGVLFLKIPISNTALFKKCTKLSKFIISNMRYTNNIKGLSKENYFYKLPSLKNRLLTNNWCIY